MSQHNITEDQVARRIVRFILILQLVVLVPVLVIALTGMATLALVIVTVTILISLGTSFWLYYRYQAQPTVKEKNFLQNQKRNLEGQIYTQRKNILSNQQTRRRLLETERNETAVALRVLQDRHIKEGMESSSIANATITGIGPKLKERLIVRGIVSAANVDQTSISSVEGFGEVKRQTLLSWRNNLYNQFYNTKPVTLPAEQAEEIKWKFEAKHASIDDAENKAEVAKTSLESELKNVLGHFEKFAPITFINYLLNAISANRLTSSILGIVFIITLVSSGISASIGLTASTANLSPTLDVGALQTSAVETTIAHFTQSAPTRTVTPNPSPTIIITPTLFITNTVVFAVSTSTGVAVTEECYIGDQLPYVYSPDRLKVLANCIHVTGLVDDVRKEADGDLHILLKLDPQYAYLLTPANINELGDLVVEPVCVDKPTQADAIEPCSRDPDPLQTLPFKGQHIWMEGRYVTDSDHGGWAEIHPLGRWGVEGQTEAQPTLIPLGTSVAKPTTITGGRVRTGASCVDGSSSSATGRGACSRHGGVSCWRYSDNTCTNP